MAAEHTHLSDPGKDDRAAHGVPVVPSYDGFRAYAIMGIVLFHVLINSGVVAREGGDWLGQTIWGVLPNLVDVLFLISGFVVFLPTVAQGGHFGSVRAYAIRRAARLLPAFWLSLAILLVVMAVLPAASVPGWGEILIDFSGQHQVARFFDTSLVAGFGINLPLWTLTLEIGFYIVLPFIASAYFRRPFVGLAIAAAIAIVWRFGFAHLDDIASVFGMHPSPQRALDLRFVSDAELPHWAFSFAAGMTSAWVYVRVRTRFAAEQVERIAAPISAAALAATAAFAYLAGRYAIDWPFPFTATVARQSAFIGLGYTAALATLMLSLALGPMRYQLPFAHPLARRLGDISYGVYLIHGVILWVLLVELNLPTGGTVAAFAVWAALVIPSSMLYGYLSARFVEQPIRRWARQFGRQAQSKGARADPAAAA